MWTEMLANLGPDGRTQRIGMLTASMLRHAASLAVERDGSDPPEGSVSYSLLVAEESHEPEEAVGEIRDLLSQPFEDAGVKGDRVSARGDEYSVLEAAAYEYIHWYDMPWE